MPPRRHPANQEPLPDMLAEQAATDEAAPQNTVLDLNQRRAFGKVPNLLSQVESANTDVTLYDQDIDRTNPRLLAQYLQVPGADYRQGNYVDGILLNDVEYTAIPRNVPALDRQIRTRIEKKRQLLSPEARAEAAQDGVRHALERYQSQQLAAIKGFDSEIANLKAMAELIKRPGFAHTTAGNLLRMTAAAWEISFMNILNVSAKQAGWTTAEKDRTSEALRRIFTEDLAVKGNVDHPQRRRMTAWAWYTQLGTEYAANKRSVFESRSNGITEYLHHLERHPRDRFAS